MLAKFVLIKLSRLRRAESKFMPGKVVCMSMRNKPQLLSPPNIDAEINFGQKQSTIKVKHDFSLYSENRTWGIPSAATPAEQPFSASAGSA
jgi:hypothetical protein